jgi:hypothetical protein
VKEDPAAWSPVLQKVVWFVALAPYDPMQQSLLHAIAKDTKLVDLPLHKQLMKQFTTKVGPCRFNRPISIYRLGEMPIQSCVQSVSAPRGKAGAGFNAHTELQAKRQRSAREAIYRNRPVESGLPARLVPVVEAKM